MLCLTEISYNPNIVNNEYNRMNQEWLLDPESSREALQTLRILKVRETGNLQVIPNIIGRETGQDISFSDTITYDDLKMRRKAEILKYTNNKITNNLNNKKINYSYHAKSSRSKYKSMTNSRIKSLKQSQICENKDIILKTGINSGIKNSKSLLFLNPSIPFYSQI